MKAALRNTLATAVLLAAVLIAAWQGEPWTAAVISSLFVFVLFPRWRKSIYRLIVRVTTHYKRHRCNDDRGL